MLDSLVHDSTCDQILTEKRESSFCFYFFLHVSYSDDVFSSSIVLLNRTHQKSFRLGKIIHGLSGTVQCLSLFTGKMLA